MGSESRKIFRTVVQTQIGVFAALILLSCLFHSLVSLDIRMSFGLDFRDFVKAAGDYLAGINPYERSRFNKPPWVVLAHIPLKKIGAASNVYIYFVLSLGALLTSIFLSAHRFSKDLRGWMMLSVAAIAFSFPAFFLLDRGNLDAFVALFCMLYLSAWSNGRERLAGAMLGVATCIKIYPGLLILPALVFFRPKILETFAAVMAFSFVTVPMLWMQFVFNPVLSHRLSEYQTGINENGSLVNVLTILSSFFSSEAPSAPSNAWNLVGWGLLGALTLGTMVWDFRLKKRLAVRAQPLLAVTYLPLMMLMPKTVYLYEFVNFLPWAIAMGAVVKNFEAELGKWHSQALVVLGVGVALTQFPVAAAASVLSGRIAWRFYAIPGIAATALAVLATLWLRWKIWRELLLADKAI